MKKVVRLTLETRNNRRGYRSLYVAGPASDYLLTENRQLARGYISQDVADTDARKWRKTLTLLGLVVIQTSTENQNEPA